MKKITLSERELTNIIKRVINEQETTNSLIIPFNELGRFTQDFVKQYGLNQNGFEWGDSSKGAINYKGSKGFVGLGSKTIQDLENNIAGFNQIQVLLKRK